MLSSYRVYLEHYLYLEEIVSTLCVMRFAEVNDCQGSCQLKKEVEKSQKESNDKSEEKRNNFKVRDTVFSVLSPIKSYVQNVVYKSYEISFFKQPYIEVESSPPIC